MKKLTKILLAIGLVLIGFSCDREEEVTLTKVAVSFGVDDKDFESGRLNSAEIPASIILTIVDNQGKAVVENKKLALLQFGQGYVTEGVELFTGSYKLTKFLVLNSSDKIVYATPLEGSDKALQVNDPLPISFTVAANANTKVVPQVLAVTSTDTPQSFGYTSFGFEIVNGPEILKVKFKVQFQVGDILYQDVDTKITVTGLDSLDNAKWVQEFNYIGPTENELSLNKSFYKYSFEVHHWGITDKMVITRNSLRESRADGPSPVTYILSGTTQARKISYYVNYVAKPDATTPGSTYLVPESKVEYQYGWNGKVENILFSSYSENTASFIPQRDLKFIYDNDHVVEITAHLAGIDRVYSQTFYSYGSDGNVTDMLEKNYFTEITSNAHLSYLVPNSIVRVEYKISNGRSFEYELSYPWKSMTADKTTQGAELCSQGIYTNDKNINPFKHLGYVDFLMRDFSINNRLTENVNYIGCAFPSLIPESYSYVYDAFGYPTSSTKYYKPNSAGGQVIFHVKYFYQ